MSIPAWNHEIADFCRAHGDPAIVAKYARFFKEGYDAYGVDDATLQAFRAGFIARHAAALTHAACLKLGRILMASGKWEKATTAIVLLRHIRAELNDEALTEIELWLDDYVTNWAVCDALSSDPLSPLLLDGRLTLGRLAEWRLADSRWRRRALPVTLIALAKRGDRLAPLLTLLEPLLLDGERVVQQGLGWCLRECWKRDAPLVEALLLKYKDRAPRLIYQYACEKMDAAGKARFKRARA